MGVLYATNNIEKLHSAVGWLSAVVLRSRHIAMKLSTPLLLGALLSGSGTTSAFSSLRMSSSSRSPLTQQYKNIMSIHNGIVGANRVAPRMAPEPEPEVRRRPSLPCRDKNKQTNKKQYSSFVGRDSLACPLCRALAREERQRALSRDGVARTSTARFSALDIIFRVRFHILDGGRRLINMRPVESTPFLSTQSGTLGLKYRLNSV